MERWKYEISAIPQNLRSQYLILLPFSQEFFVESLVQAGQCYCLKSDGIIVPCYGIVTNDKIVEFYCADAELELSAFHYFVSTLNLGGAIVKSFDVQLKELCDHYLQHCNLCGPVATSHLFRKFESNRLESLKLESMCATAEHVQDILDMCDDFFEGHDEILKYIQNEHGGCVIYKWIDEAQMDNTSITNSIVGCGIYLQIVAGLPPVDVGMVVTPLQRRKGIGSHIVRDMAERCLQLGYVPVCGCAASNVDSKRTLESAGFTAEHSLLRYTFK